MDIWAVLPPVSYWNNDVISIGVQIPLQNPAFSFLGYIPRGEIARSYGGTILTF